MTFYGMNEEFINKLFYYFLSNKNKINYQSLIFFLMINISFIP